jgi:nitrile hydratase accessory protein
MKPGAATLDADGPAAPPRKNGELVFGAPWESRVFGVTMALHQAGVFEWEEFRLALIAEIASSEAANSTREGWSYYERWQKALEQLLAAKGVFSAADLEARVHAFGERPEGHDHP